MTSTEKQNVELLHNYHEKFTPANFALKSGTSIGDIDSKFLASFLEWRLWAKRYMLITSAYRPGDPRAHGHGLALDVILFDQWLNKPTYPREQWLKATTWPFKGVGIYFDWHFTNKDGNYTKTVGLHVDHFFKSRPLRWLRITKRLDVGGENKPRRLYYYQNPKTGLFYNSDINETVSLDNVINEWEA